MNPEVTVTLTITAVDDKILVTAVQTAGGEDQVLEVASVAKGRDTAVLDLPPPPQAAAFESLASMDLPPVPEIDAATEQALESLAMPDLPPVPDAPEPAAAFERLAVPDLPPVPEAPQDERFTQPPRSPKSKT